jgi:hypothetical protein
VKPGDYFIVEDSISHHGLPGSEDDGPYRAIEAFLIENTNFESDRTREAFGITWNPKGFLRRKAGDHFRGALEKRSWATRETLKRFVKLFVPPILIKFVRLIRR